MDLDFLTEEELIEGGILVMLVGPPGAGKSVLAEKLKKDYVYFEIVCPDDIREEICGDASDQTHNNAVFGKVYTRLTTLLTEGYNVIYDATNCRASYRRKIMNVVDGCYKKVICICLLTSLSDCFKNNSLRDRQVPEDVIERMYINMRNHAPTLFEGYDVILKSWSF